MSGFLQVPQAALDLAADWQDKCIVFGLYELADEQHFESFKASSRMLRARFGGASGRRVEAIVNAMVAEGLIVMEQEGTPRNPRVLRVLRWKQWASTGETSVPQANERNAGGNAGRNAPDLDRSPAQADVPSAPDKSARNAGRNADGNARRARSLTRPQTPDLSHSPPTPQPADAARGASDAQTLSDLGLDSRLQSACTSSGLTTPAALAALTPSELRQRPGIGTKSVRTIAAALARAGLSLQPDPEKADRKAVVTDAGRAAGGVWSAAWRELHAGSAYPWDMGPGGRDRQHVERLAAIAQIAQAPDAGAHRLRAAASAYLRAHRQGQAWPQGEPATLATFVAVAAKWLQRIDQPQQGVPAGGGAEAAWSAIAELNRRGHLAQAVNGRRLHADPDENARREAAFRAAGSMPAFRSLDQFTEKKVREAFIRAYQESANARAA